MIFIFNLSNQITKFGFLCMCQTRTKLFFLILKTEHFRFQTICFNFIKRMAYFFSFYFVLLTNFNYNIAKGLDFCQYFLIFNRINLTSVFWIIVEWYSGIFLLLLIKFVFDFIENILKKFGVQDTFGARLRSFAFWLLSAPIYFIAQQFPNKEITFSFLFLYYFSYVLYSKNLIKYDNIFA